MQRPSRTDNHPDRKLLAMVAEYRELTDRIEQAEQLPDGVMSDDEFGDLSNRQTALAYELVTSPARTGEGLAAKLSVLSHAGELTPETGNPGHWLLQDKIVAHGLWRAIEDAGGLAASAAPAA